MHDAHAGADPRVQAWICAVIALTAFGCATGTRAGRGTGSLLAATSIDAALDGPAGPSPGEAEPPAGAKAGRGICEGMIEIDSDRSLRVTRDRSAVTMYAMISENEFLRRYRARIGPPAPSPRWHYARLWAAGGLILGGGCAIFGATELVGASELDDNHARISDAEHRKRTTNGNVLLVVGAGVAVVGAALGFLGRDDDSPSERRVDDPKLAGMIARYNRTLGCPDELLAPGP